MCFETLFIETKDEDFLCQTNSRTLHRKKLTKKETYSNLLMNKSLLDWTETPICSKLAETCFDFYNNDSKWKLVSFLIALKDKLSY